MPSLTITVKPWVVSLRRTAETALRWWIGELEAAYAEWIAARLGLQASRARLNVGAREIVLQESSGGSWMEVSRCDRPDDWQASAVAAAALIGVPTARYRHIDVVLPAEAVLRRAIEMPVAVRSQLASAFGLQLDRLTPFRPEDVYWGAGEGGPVQRLGRIGCELAVVRRSTVDVLVTSLRHAAGARFRVVAPFAAGTGQLCLLQFRGIRNVRSTVGTVRWTLVATGSVLILAIALTGLIHRRAEQQRIDSGLEAVRTQAHEAEATRSALQQRRMRVAYLIRQSERTGAAQLIAEITRTLPQDGWVSQFQQDHDAIEIAGETKNATDAAAALGRSPLFKSVILRSAIQQSGGASERFDIALTLKDAGWVP